MVASKREEMDREIDHLLIVQSENLRRYWEVSQAVCQCCLNSISVCLIGMYRSDPCACLAIIWWLTPCNAQDQSVSHGSFAMRLSGTPQEMCLKQECEPGVLCIVRCRHLWCLQRRIVLNTNSSMLSSIVQSAACTATCCLCCRAGPSTTQADISSICVIWLAG